MEHQVKYYKQLDSLRFFSVLSVMIGHWMGWDSDNFLIKTFHWGNGVIFFFVLSGFLITEILYNEKTEIETGNKTFFQSLKTFYIKRTLRIFPIYYLLIIYLFYINYKNTREIFPYLITYTSNILEAKTNNYVGEFNHFWSLAVEEQFYIIWPIFILLISKKHLLKFICGTIILSIISRICFIIIAPDKWMAASYLTNNVMFALGIGALLAYIKNARRSLFNKISSSMWLAPLVGAIYILLLYKIVRKDYVPSINFILDELVFCILSALVISRAVGDGYKYVAKFILENKNFTHLGQISYGLYVYHLFAIPTYWDYIAPKLSLHTDKKETAWMLYFLFTWLCAEISYIIIEQPFNYLKKYFK
jgi:peptidoglycan/LPS O-acetylase OafA/YrhL